MTDDIKAQNLFGGPSRPNEPTPPNRPQTVQAQIAAYHSTLNNPHRMHSQWHANNPDPRPPRNPMDPRNRPNGDYDPLWGTRLDFGARFLQMHNRMVSGVINWFRTNGYRIPNRWNPLSPIPNELAFNPTDGLSGRDSNNPRYQLPSYFTAAGGQRREPITGARRLADFRNVNQLGCCIVYHHNAWHAAIGGAMNSFTRAIDDPIFYFGVHRHVDEVYTTYQRISRQRNFRNSESADVPEERLDRKELDELMTWEEIGITLE